MYNIDYDYVAEYCKRNWSGMVDKVIKIADDVSQNTFLFNMDWDMERTIEPTHFDGEIDWYLMKNHDNEYLFQMSRQRYLINLAQAYKLTGLKEYAFHVVRIMKDFINRVPVQFDSKDHPWRSLEVGLRGEYWTKAMAIIKDSEYVTQDFIDLYLKSLDDHAKILLKFHEQRHKLSNWGVIQDHGLFDIGLELDNKEYIDTAISRLAKQCELQLMNDGVHWEQSCMYHNEVMNCFVDVIIRAQAKKIVIPECIIKNTHRMALANMAWIMPNYKQPLFGDSDYTDLRDLLSQTAYIFRDSTLKCKAHDILDYESAWLFGKEGIDNYKKLKGDLPEYKSISLSDSGMSVMRNDWSENSNYLVFHNGYTGGGHAHCDKLSFDLSLNGKDFLVDTGRYTYKCSDKIRVHTKSARGHNTITVDNRDFMKFIGWGYHKYAPSLKQELVIRDKFEMISGSHLGYMSFISSVVPCRKILWIKPDIYIVFDTFYTKGMHSYQQIFNFAPNINPIIEGSSVTCVNGGTDFCMKFLNEKTKIKKYKGFYSMHYNMKEDIYSVKTNFRAIGLKSVATVISSDKEMEVNIKQIKSDWFLPGIKNYALGMEIKKSGDIFTVFFTAKEINQCVKINGKDFTGKLAYYKNDEYNVVEW